MTQGCLFCNVCGGPLNDTQHHLRCDGRQGRVEAAIEPPFFDVKRGRALKAAAMAEVDDHASEAWKQEADTAIEAVARRQWLLTTDDVWLELRERGVPPPHEPRALGPRMNMAAKDRVIEKVSSSRMTERPVAHRRPMQVWQSLIYQGAHVRHA